MAGPQCEKDRSGGKAIFFRLQAVRFSLFRHSPDGECHLPPPGEGIWRASYPSTPQIPSPVAKNARSRAKKRLREKHCVYFAKTFFNLAYLGRDATVGRSG